MKDWVNEEVNVYTCFFVRIIICVFKILKSNRIKDLILILLGRLRPLHTQ